MRPAWNKTNHNQTHPTNITQEDRISTLETQVVSIKSQIQNLTHTNSNLKNQINEVQNKVESMAINIEEKFGAIQNSHSDTNSEIKSLAKNMNLISESIDTLIQASKSNHVSNPPTIPNQNLAPNSLTRKLSFSPLSHNVPIPQSLPTNSLTPIAQKNEPSRSRSYIPNSTSHNPQTLSEESQRKSHASKNFANSHIKLLQRMKKDPRLPKLIRHSPYVTP